VANWKQLIESSGLPRSEALALMAHALGRDIVWFIAHDTDEASGDEAEKAASFVRRRAAGEPLAYITGEREFYGLALNVTPDVLIPRPETELLVELALDKLSKGGQFLDIGTGCGAIAIAVAAHRSDVQVFASDISAAALSVARSNANRHKVDVQFVESDGLNAFAAKEAFDVIVSNPPYVAAGDPHLGQGDLRFEPSIALACGPDGLDLIRRLTQDVVSRLRHGGWWACEHGYDQSRACLTLWQAAGFANVADRPDLAGIPRVCAGQKAGI
jgi:release factor glutamine methyltransferase